MRTALCLLICPVLAAQGSVPKEIAGKDLATVPGPFVDRFCSVPGYRDPAAGPGNSSIQMQIRESARRGPSIPARALPDGPVAVKDIVGSAAGWKAYQVRVPAGAKVHARVHSAHDAWFVVRTVNRMGALEEGMLRNLIGTGNPEATYTNPKKETNTIFFVVDTTEIDVNSEPYTLAVD
ncbi:MAG TPA: hypothetical protein VFF76_05030 [Holophagaceae bacterium]|jgi:hypothetical protein|nr:hypothetical protein [Holophagaceae bacterium]